jgi:L-ascorbate metabolism protein UlaG (beta-lactamase superfamily)
MEAMEPQLRVTWVGHSTVLIELDGVRLLTDPMLRPRVSFLMRVAGRTDVAALGALDAVLISHLHYDHLDIGSLGRLGRNVPVVVPTGAARLLRGRGFSRILELDVGGEASVGPLTIRATPAEHEGSRGPLLANAAAVGYLISGSARLYFAGDTDLFDDMREVAPDLDVALLPVAGWGPRLPPGHLDPRRAAEALQLLQPRVAVPIHWGTYRRIGVRGDPASLRAPADEFVQHARELAPETDVRVVPVGGTLELSSAAHETVTP